MTSIQHIQATTSYKSLSHINFEDFKVEEVELKGIGARQKCDVKIKDDQSTITLGDYLDIISSNGVS